MFSLICVWINGWVNNCEAGDLRRRRVHYDVIVMSSLDRHTDQITDFQILVIPDAISWDTDNSFCSHANFNGAIAIEFKHNTRTNFAPIWRRYHALWVGICVWASRVHAKFLSRASVPKTYMVVKTDELLNLGVIKISTVYMKILSFNVWVWYIVRNFIGHLWNSRQNILPTQWKMWILFIWKFLDSRVLVCFSKVPWSC